MRCRLCKYLRVINEMQDVQAYMQIKEDVYIAVE